MMFLLISLAGFYHSPPCPPLARQ